jgi:hypothetical protein
MSSGWFFQKQDIRGRARDPIQGEFFAAESIAGPAEALVREGIQNALDARLLTTSGPVRVRIYLSGDSHALPASRVETYLGSEFWQHIGSSGNGLRSRPQQGQPCPFIVFEDFGTTGLTGDIEQSVPLDNVSNAFYFFFRAEGRTDKLGGKGGSWGVGKTVFPRSSRANTIFALSARSGEPGHVLMGTMTLKHRRVGPTWFTPDAWFGLKDVDQQDRPVMPVVDTALIRAFAHDFGLHRTNEAGLSIVVPWYDPQEITKTMLCDATLRGWFYPILGGRLEVVFADAAGEFVLTTQTLDEYVARATPAVRFQIEPLLELARHLAGTESSDRITLSPPDPGAPKWSKSQLPPAVLGRLQSGLQSKKPVCVRVPIPVRRKGDSVLASYFDLCLKMDPAASARVTFLRDDIIIPEAKVARLRGARAMVVAEHQHISELLRDAEHPAHTHWNKDTSNFKQKYDTGPSYLSFVQNSVFELLRLLQSEDQAEDPKILEEFFSVSATPEDDAPQDGTQGVAIQTPTNQKRPNIPPMMPAGKPKSFRVTKAAGGFTIRGTGQAPPKALKVLVAYNCRRKNPFKKWNVADFDLAKSPVEIGEQRGLAIQARLGNTLRVEPQDPSFCLTLKGFDPNRDLIVSVKSEEPS